MMMRGILVVILGASLLLCLASQTHANTFLRQRNTHTNEMRHDGIETPEDSSYWERLLEEASSMPTDGGGDGGKVGDDCFSSDDCKTGTCFIGLRPPDIPGICTCNPSTNEGCDEGLECLASNEIAEIQGIADLANECFIPFDAPCGVDDSGVKCVTGVCDTSTNTCQCNQLTSYPCDTANGERCVVGGETSWICYAPGDGTVGSDCFDDEDCNSKSCVEDPPNASGVGRCSCNPETGIGCGGDFFCATPEEIGMAVGELISVSPHCKIPVGLPCDDASDCLTAVCSSGVCSCNPNTNWPCDVANGELCLSSEGFVCTDPGDIGDGTIGSECFSDTNCESGSCFIGVVPQGDPGVCSCNPSTNYGCDGDFECFSSEDLVKIRGVFDLAPDCYLPHAALCDGRSDISGSCVTGNCSNVTSRCTCNELTDWPCDTSLGEACKIDAEGSLACIAGEVKPLTNCPDPDGDIVCTAQYDPVLCKNGECEYSNQCVATSADPSFTSETCAPVCPPAFTDKLTACTKEFEPVKCGTYDCQYNNQCLATSADPSFTNETCTSLAVPDDSCPVFGGICTLEYAPVICEPGGCEYTNPCFATGANANYTAETCTPTDGCPLFDGICTLEYAPVKCEPGGCEYVNQCQATGANANYTSETCIPVPP